VSAVVVLAAKVGVLFGFACALALAQNAVPTAAIAWRTSGWAAVAHATTVVLAVALVTVVVTLVYGICARLVPRARFDDVAAWSQIGLALLFASLAILMPRSTLRTGTLHVDPGARQRPAQVRVGSGQIDAAQHACESTERRRRLR